MPRASEPLIQEDGATDVTTRSVDRDPAVARCAHRQVLLEECPTLGTGRLVHPDLAQANGTRGDGGIDDARLQQLWTGEALDSGHDGKLRRPRYQGVVLGRKSNCFRGFNMQPFGPQGDVGPSEGWSMVARALSTEPGELCGKCSRARKGTSSSDAGMSLPSK